MRTLLCLLASLLLVVPSAAEDEPTPPGPRGGGAGGGGGPDGGPGGRRRGGRGNPWERLERMDADGDGKVTRDEFRGPDRMFDRLDADGDGSVTEKEAGSFRRPGGRDRPGGQRSRGNGGTSMLSPQKVDTNRDGRITKEEWAAFHAAADKNGDGVLDKDEWAAAASGGRLRDPAPAVGTPAPKVSAKRAGTNTVVDLSAPKRVTVLIFGSHT